MRAIFGVTLTVCALFALSAYGQGTQAQQGAPQSAQAQQGSSSQMLPESSQQSESAQAPLETQGFQVEPEPQIMQNEEAQEQLHVAETEQEPTQQEPQGAQLEQSARRESQKEHKVKLGVIWLESATGHDKLAFEQSKVLLENLEDMGLYEIYYPEDIEKALTASGVRIASNCRDRRCVNDIGRALGARRMIYGSVDMTGSRCGVRLSMLNVVTGKNVESISIEGAVGVPAKEVLICALNRLHGNMEEASVTEYYGPPVNNLSEFLWSTIAVQGTGLFYSLINYGAGGGEKSDNVEYAPYIKNQTLSGISGSSNQIPFFARPAALANAYTAVSDDAYGVLYNPAGMAWVTRRDAVASYQYRFGLDLIGVAYAGKATRDLGFGQALLLATDRDGAMTEMFFVTSAGYKFNDVYFLGPMSAGVSLKFMGSTVRALSPDSPRGQSYGMGLDLGCIWELSHDIRYGFMFRDLPSANFWKNRTTGERYTESLPPTLHMGGSYRASYAAFLTADGQIPLYADQPWAMAGGIEYEFFRILALRIGLQREILDEESNWWKITTGVGIKIDTRAQWGKSMNFDIAYEYNTLEEFPVVNASVKVGF